VTTTPLPSRCLALITDRRVCGGSERLEWAVEAAVAGGVQLVQLREKDLAADDLLPLAQRLRRLTEGAALLFVNGDVDVALACGADGVHLAETSLSVAEARKIAAGQPLLIGRSVHDLAGALMAQENGADLLQAGPVYATVSHPGTRPAGLKLISDMSASVDLPVLGVGGVTSEHVSEVLSAGALGVAVIRAVLTALSPYWASQQLRDALDHAPMESSSAIPIRAPGP
jgi:thiamine-phosphate diphosphorylase